MKITMIQILMIIRKINYVNKMKLMKNYLLLKRLLSQINQISSQIIKIIY